mmetsp:Transcript_5535/g.6309  ORF Transcript_5535/g.6309 Transcript_5535/m.6309 type:complete len:125 (+) Transcript_5535:965-1339(+)
MAGWIVDKLVSELSNVTPKFVHIPVNFESYTDNPTIVCEIFSECNPNMRVYSLNEVYLDTGPFLALLYCTALKLMRRVVVTVVSRDADRVSTICISMGRIMPPCFRTRKSRLALQNYSMTNDTS